jgi:hypothetical protein
MQTPEPSGGRVLSSPPLVRQSALPFVSAESPSLVSPSLLQIRQPASNSSPSVGLRLFVLPSNSNFGGLLPFGGEIDCSIDRAALEAT